MQQKLGLEIELYKIGDSKVAPNFKMVCQPDNWSQSISREAKTAYGSFYRYFNNLDEIHEATIIQVVLERAADLEKELENEKSNPSIKKFFQKAKSFWKN